MSLAWGDANAADVLIIVAGFVGPRICVELRCLSCQMQYVFNDHALRIIEWELSEDQSPQSLTQRITMTPRLDDCVVASALRLSAPEVLNLNSSCGTALMYAVKRNCVPLCAMLLTGQADANAMDSSGWSALSLACWNGKNTVVSVLLRSKAETNARATKGIMYTPLMAAARCGHSNVVAQLLMARADASLTTSFGETALSLAMHGEHGEACHLLGSACQGVDWHGSSLRHDRRSLGSRQAQRVFEHLVSAIHDA